MIRLNTVRASQVTFGNDSKRKPQPVAKAIIETIDANANSQTTDMWDKTANIRNATMKNGYPELTKALRQEALLYNKKH